MRNTKGGRVRVCGLVAGFVWSLLSVIFMAFGRGNFLAAAPRLSTRPFPLHRNGGRASHSAYPASRRRDNAQWSAQSWLGFLF